MLTTILKRTQVLLAAVVLTTLSLDAVSQSTNPFVGSWDIDLRASNFGSTIPPTNMSRTYFDHEDGTYTYMVITTNQDGTLAGSTAHYSYSGDQYPIASFTGDQRALISYRRTNDNTVEYTVHLNGAVQQIGAKFISPNQQQLSIAIQYPNSDQENQLLIFNRRM